MIWEFKLNAVQCKFGQNVIISVLLLCFHFAVFKNIPSINHFKCIFIYNSNGSVKTLIQVILHITSVSIYTWALHESTARTPQPCIRCRISFFQSAFFFFFFALNNILFFLIVVVGNKHHHCAQEEIWKGMYGCEEDRL